MSVQAGLYTRAIIRVNGRWLRGVNLCTKKPELTVNTWDAWHTRKMEDARKVALRIRGEVWLFNAATGDLEEVARK